MKPHPRIRKTIKWGGAALTVLLVVVWIGSAVWYLGHVGTNYVLRVEPGRIVIIFEALPATSITRRTYWESHAQPLNAPWGWWFDGGSVGGATGFTWIAFPLWVTAAAAFLLTALAFRLDTLARRRARLHLCPRCHYDRIGLPGGADAVCPECGTGSGGASPVAKGQ